MPAKRQPNIVLLVSDQHAARVAGCYGDPIATTPALDALAHEGATFEDAYCPAPLCKPSRMSLLTGRYPSQHSCMTNRAQLHPGIPTFAHSLGAAGYKTVLVGRMHTGGYDVHHGFVERHLGEIDPTLTGGTLEPLGEAAVAEGGYGHNLEHSGLGKTFYDYYDEAVTTTAIATLQRLVAEQQPFLLVVGWFLPHPPFVCCKDDYHRYAGRVPGPRVPHAQINSHPLFSEWRLNCGFDQVSAKAVLRSREIYYAMVETLDRAVGRVVTALEATCAADNTFVAYTSDHGEHLGEHGSWHKCTFFDVSAKVPMICKWPGVIPAGNRIKHPVNLVDLAVTLCAVGSGSPLPGAAGRNLLPLTSGSASADWDDVTFSEFYGGLILFDGKNVPARMMRSGVWKIMIYDGYESQLYKLDDDPLEQNNLAGNPAVASIQFTLEAKARADWPIHAIRHRLATSEMEEKLLAAWTKRWPGREPERWRNASLSDNTLHPVDPDV